ncbi:MAG TPA: AMP-binding protein [Myxococcota bacterium]|nr:AMP-binding protein [Myxococcota bacterium]
MHSVARWIADRAHTAPAQLAVADPWRRLDYAALEQRIQRAAGVLAAAGVSRGERVALVLGNRSATLELVFACARLGAIAAPLNTRLAPPEIAQLLADCRPRVLAFDASMEPQVRTALAQSGHTCALTLAVGGEPDAYEAALFAAVPERTIADVSPDDAMILMYTSGTTGVPKGALLPHRKTLFNSRNAELFFRLEPRDRVLVAVPLFHSFGLKILAIPALYAGGSVVLQGSFDASETWRTVARERITLLGGVPTMFRALGDAFDRDRPDVPSLRFLFTAGAAIPVEQIHAFERRGLVLKQGFGQTETSILCCLDAQDAVRKAGSVGRPVQHAELRIVRSDTLALAPSEWRDCAVGETGEIVVRGPITMLGYWERPEATAETIRAGGWLVTGDLGAFDAEGFVTLTGRSKDLFISGGENVYPRQVEAAYEAHPDILEIAVIGIPDDRWGEVGRAYVALRPGAKLDPEALIAFGRERLASFKVPRSFVQVKELPRTASGKVQKFKLQDRPG